MIKNEAIKRVVNLARSEVGYRPYSGKRTKFADYLDGLGDVYNGKKSGYDWCDVFVDYLFIKTFGERDGMSMLYQEYRGLGAGCGYSANYFRRHGAFSKTPQIGSQIFYGVSGNEYHTGLVVDVDSTYVYTVEGNIGGGNGKVGEKKIKRTDGSISGYGIPKWSVVEGVEKMKTFGIDISAWQGNYPLDKAQKEGVKFVILKGGGADDGYYKDSKFERNYELAKKLGLKVGCYWFSYAMNPEQARNEAEYFYQNCLKGKKFELPVYIDVENKTQLNIGKRGVTEVIKAFCEHLEKKDFWVGIYSSLSYFHNYMYDSELKKYCHWVAQWSTHLDYDCGLWQFGGETNLIRSNRVAGIVTDQNYLLYDYEKDIKERGKNGYPKPKPAIGFTRVSGKTRYQTAIEVAKKIAPYEAVILASGENYSDALSATYLAKIKKAPILLTNDNEMKEVCSFINKTAKQCFIVGGQGAVSDLAEKNLKVPTERISGRDRYDTNLEILKQTFKGDKLVVVTGKNYPDAISVSACKMPIMIVGDKLTEGQLAWLSEQKLSIIYAVGGTLPVSALDIFKKLAKVKRISGKNRYETSRLVATEFFASTKKVIMVTGQNYPDGLVASRLVEAPVLLVDDNCFMETQKFNAKVKPTKAYVVGGTLSDRVVNWALTF